MTPFDAHDIDHLSASSLNLWMANPREWAVRYLAKQTDEADPAMWRGSAVEAGLAQLLHGRSLDAARTTAIDSFEYAWMDAQLAAADNPDDPSRARPCAWRCSSRCAASTASPTKC